MIRTLYLTLLLLCSGACTSIGTTSRSAPLPTVHPTAFAFLPLTPPPTPPVTPSPVPIVPTDTAEPVFASWRLGATAAVPAELVHAAEEISRQQPERFSWVGQNEADVVLTVNDGSLLAQWVYAVAVPFATLRDDISLAEIQAGWQTSPIIIDENTAATMSMLWGQPGAAVRLVPRENLSSMLWAERSSWTILPFHRLTPELKVLHLDGQSPLEHAFTEASYPLALYIGATGQEAAVGEFLSIWQGPTTNREPSRMTHVAMTGVTALTRATAYQMELNGISYPGTAVASVLQEADIAHISNEVAFAPDCPYPNPIGGTTFCSRDSYFALLEELEIDVVELTGNHVNDWGSDNLLHSIGLYKNTGMVYFGGGETAADAARPALFEHNGNRIAFVGCNPVGPNYAWATEVSAGSRRCTDDFYTQITNLQQQGYLVIATLQYYEIYYYAPTTQQRIDFQKVAEAGAIAVSGSQGHHAQGFAFHNNAFIHYGLGNLFFDQMDMLGTRQTFVDTYVIYDGRLLSVKLWTGLIENWARPRLMTPEERLQALSAVFQGSGW